MTIANYRIRVRYEGGVADDNMLPLYDGTASIHGIAKSLQIATHAFVNDDIVSRATAWRGAKVFLLPAKKGSYLVDLLFLIEQNPLSFTVDAPIFYDFVKTILIKATSGRAVIPETKSVKKRLDKDEPFFDDLAETLEGSLQGAHRPIGEGVPTISIERPRSKLITLDQTTRDWVETREEIPLLDDITGNVTRYNSVTRNGRLYVDQLHRIVPFKPDGDFPLPGINSLTWSLHGSANGLPKKLKLTVKHIKSATNETKRLLLSDCKRDEDT